MPKVIGKEKLLEDFERMYGDRFDYSKIDDWRIMSKGYIHCKKHDHWYIQDLRSHHKGSVGCKECQKEKVRETRRIPWIEVEKQFREIHGEKYIYFGETYLNSVTPMKMYCPIHDHTFYQRPDSHKNAKHGCSKCGDDRVSDRLSLDIEDTYLRLKKSQPIHIKPVFKDFKNTAEKVAFYCERHKQNYTQNLTAALKSFTGCPACKSVNYSGVYTERSMTLESANNPCRLYLVRFTREDGTTFDKVGITKRSAVKRFRPAVLKKMKLQIEVIYEYLSTLYDCKNLESAILEVLQKTDNLYRVKDFQKTRIGGWTECFPSGNKTVEDYFETIKRGN